MTIFNMPHGDLVLEDVSWVGGISANEDVFRFCVIVRGSTIHFDWEDEEFANEERSRLLKAIEDSAVFDYLEQHKQASKMIEDYGKPMILRRIRVIGSPTGGTVEEFVAEQEVMAVRVSFEHFHDGNINKTSRRYYISAEALKPELVDLAPYSEMRLVDIESEATTRFSRVRGLTPGEGTLVFDVQSL